MYVAQIRFESTVVKFLRYGSVLKVIIKYIMYTSNKLGDYQEKVVLLNIMQ